MKKLNWKLIATVALPVVGGSVLGRVATKDASEKYENFKTPRFSPPSWLFPVAWTSLYTMMGIAKYTFDKKVKPKQRQQMGNFFYYTQLGLNFLWSPLFFKEEKRGIALVDASFLWLAVVSTTSIYNKHSQTAGKLMLPYVGWSAYAMYLNYATWKLNKDY